MAYVSHTIHLDDEDSPRAFTASTFTDAGRHLGFLDVAPGSRIIGTPRGLEALADILMTLASLVRAEGRDASVPAVVESPSV